METTIKRTRQFLAWHLPGEAELGRVELLSARSFYDPDPGSRRTAEEVTIPAGAVIMYMTEDPPVHA